MSAYSEKSFAEVLDDYVLVRGDLDQPYARHQLSALVEGRINAARAAGAEAVKGRVRDLATRLESDEKSEPGDNAFPMDASAWDLALDAIVDDIRDTLRATDDVVPAEAGRMMVPAPQALREVADEILAELICCTDGEPDDFKHSICRFAGMARALVIDRAERIEQAHHLTWAHASDGTVCKEGPVEDRPIFCREHGRDVILVDASRAESGRPLVGAEN